MMKISCVDEIRRVNQSYFDFSNWDEFCKQLENLFKREFPGLRHGGRGGWRLQYTDSDGEIVTVLSSPELSEAVENLSAKGTLRFSITPQKPRWCKGWWMGQCGSQEAVPACDLKAGVIVKLQGDDGTTAADTFVVKILPSGHVCLVVEGEKQTLRIRPGVAGAPSVVDCHGHFGPFSQFAVTSNSSGHSFYNARSHGFLRVLDGQLSSFHPNDDTSDQCMVRVVECPPKESNTEPRTPLEQRCTQLTTPLHPHELKLIHKQTRWRCDSPYGCTSTMEAPRWRCTTGCDYDLCGSCVHTALHPAVPVASAETPSTKKEMKKLNKEAKKELKAQNKELLATMKAWSKEIRKEKMEMLRAVKKAAKEATKEGASSASSSSTSTEDSESE